MVVKKFGTEESEEFFVADAGRLLTLLELAFGCHGLLRNVHNQVVGDASYQLAENEVFTWHPGRMTWRCSPALSCQSPLCQTTQWTCA